MNILEYQDQAQRTLNKELEYTDLIKNLLLGLNGEVGELTDIYKKLLYHDHKINNNKIEEEIGDVLWYILNLITVEGFSIENILLQNIDKLKKRYPKGFNSEDSIKRVDTNIVDCDFCGNTHNKHITCNKNQKSVNIVRTCFNKHCEHCHSYSLLCQKSDLSIVTDCEDYLSRNIKSDKLNNKPKEEQIKNNSLCYNRSCPYQDNNSLICEVSKIININDCKGYRNNSLKIEDKELIKPTYYNSTGISPFDYIRENDLNFFEGNIVKYITRHKEKNGIEDLIKAKTYLEEIIENYDKLY